MLRQHSRYITRQALHIYIIQLLANLQHHSPIFLEFAESFFAQREFMWTTRSRNAITREVRHARVHSGEQQRRLTDKRGMWIPREGVEL